MRAKQFKVVVIGCGGRANAHLDAYKHIPEGRVTACYDINTERCETFARDRKLTPYTDLGQMLAKESPDLVHITTPPSARVDVMSAVVESGVPLCTVEKPIATGIQDWRALCKIEHRSKTRFAVCHQFRWQQHFVKCQEAVKNGVIGNVRFLDMSAGMNISGQGTHILNYGRALIGDAKVKRIFANASGWDREDTVHPGPAATEAYLMFDNGVRGLWTNGFVSPRCGDPKTVWQHVRVAAVGDLGRVNYEEFGAWEIIATSCTERGTFGTVPEWWANNLLAQAAFHRAMIAWLKKPENIPGTNLADSLHEWAVVLALYQSGLERKPIDMADFNPPDDLVDRFRRLIS